MAQGDEIHNGSGTDLFLKRIEWLPESTTTKRPKIASETAFSVEKYAQ